MSQAVDLYLVYEFIKRLSTPFEETKAFELGLINDEGKVIKKPRTSEEKNALTPFTKLIFNLKKLLYKVTGIERKLTTFAAALFLIKEHENRTGKSFISESEFQKFCFENRNITESLHEEISTNAVGTGNIAGVDNPGVVKKVLNKNRERNKKQANTVAQMGRKTFSQIRFKQ
jgi:hypothetical protein